VILDVEEMPHKDVYKLLIGSVLPRPIAFVSTRSKAGIDNLAPFSFFTVICANPPTVCFSIMRKGPAAQKKDTLTNIEETREFVINVVDESYVAAMNACSEEFEPDISEFIHSGLTPVPSVAVTPPRVGESPISLECRLKQIVEISAEPGGGSLVIGTVVRIVVRDDLYENGRIVTERWHPLGRMAGATFARVTDTFEMERP
jgi:flavin reductase (DIM6/NTAB) family NADH-FMN oxidoreductase RutF